MDGKIDDYFLGLCNLDVLLKWRYCSSILQQQIPDKCTLRMDSEMLSTRVHRRLCDFSILAPFAEQCDCTASEDMETELLRVTGFQNRFEYKNILQYRIIFVFRISYVFCVTIIRYTLR